MPQMEDAAGPEGQKRQKLGHRIALLTFSATGLFVITLLFLLWFGKPFFPAVR